MADNSRKYDLAFILLRCGMGLMLALFNGWGMIGGAYANVIHGQEWEFIGLVAKLGFPAARFFAVCAAMAEFAGGLLLAVGLFTRLASILVAMTMSVAVYFHLTTNFNFELAAHYLLAAIFFIFAGPGRYSIDEWLSQKSDLKNSQTLARDKEYAG